MNGLQVRYAFKQDEMVNYYFRGIFLNKNIPIRILEQKTCFFVVNTMVDKSRIGHWVLIYIDDIYIYFFDSLGATPSYYGGDISKNFENTSRYRIIVFSEPIQSKTSSVCGAYVIFFGYELIRNKSIDSIKSKFKHSQFRNDRIVVKYMKFSNLYFVNFVLDIYINICTIVNVVNK